MSGLLPTAVLSASVTTITPTHTHFEEAHTAAATATASPTSTNASSLAESRKTMMFGAVIGGVGAMLLLSVLAICCIQHRRKSRARRRMGGAKQMSYDGIDSRFQGVSFRDSSSSSLSPRPLLLNNSNTTYLGTLCPGQRPYEVEGFVNPNPFGSPQPSPQQSPFWPPQSPMHPYGSPHARTFSHTHLHGHSHSLAAHARSRSYSNAHARSYPNAQPRSYPQGLSRSHSRSDSIASPLTLNDPSEAHVLSSYEPLIPTELEAPKPPVRDTMGFPVEQSAILDEIRLLTMTPVLQSPRPSRTLAHQDSFERLIRDNMSPAPCSSPRRISRAISIEYRESPVLGVLSPVTIQHPSITRLGGGGLRRSDSQRTLGSESTMGPIIGDEELEKLGIGSRPQPLRLRDL